MRIQTRWNSGHQSNEPACDAPLRSIARRGSERRRMPIATDAHSKAVAVMQCFLAVLSQRFGIQKRPGAAQRLGLWISNAQA